jgi:tetratricopeptide (TPR) repeat protein
MAMILSCSGWACARLISVSDVPGGNPVARKDPEHFSSDFQLCPDCHQSYCDRCAPQRPGPPSRCRSCHGPLVDASLRSQVLARPLAEVVQLHQRGLELAGDERLAQALAVFDEVVRVREDYVDAHSNRGVALRLLGRPVEAIEAFERVATLEPGHAPAMFDIGGLYRALGRFEDAVHAYDRALARQPRHMAALINRAISLSDLNRCEEALLACDEAIRLDEAGESVERIEHARSYAYGARGAALLKLGRPAEALMAIDLAIDAGPANADNYLNRARALQHLGRTEEARHAARIGQDLRARR